MNLQVLSKNGSSTKNISLADSVFKIEPNEQAMFDVVNAKRAALRQGTHSTLDRSEVSGGGKKPWKQKHTGRARAGSNRSPIWRGGGITFGPTPMRNYKLKVNKKVYQLALKSALSLKVGEASIKVVPEWELSKPSTKGLLAKLKSLKIAADQKVLIVSKDENVIKSANNLTKVNTTSVEHLDVTRLLSNNFILIHEADIKNLEARLK